MIKFEIRSGFKKAYNKRIAQNENLRKRVKERVALFQLNPNHPLLHDHTLMGDKKGFRSFSVGGDLRIIYYLEESVAYFIDIGTHNQVY